MKISASMACLPGLPLPFVGGVALAVHFVGVSERDGPSWALNGLQHRRAAEWLMASLRPAVRFAERDVMEYLFVSSALVRLDASSLDHLSPLSCFVGYEFSEGGRCHRHRLSSQSKQPRLHSRISKDRVDLIVELVDDRRWCVFGRAEPIPTDCLISLYELAHGRDVRQSLRTRRAGHCEGTQSTCLDIASRRRHRSKRYLHLPAEQIGPVTATIRHVYQVDTGHHLEQLARDMGAAPAAGRGHVDLARIGFRIGDELGNGFDWE